VVHPLVAGIQLLFVDVRDSTRDRKHGRAARENLIPEESVPLVAALPAVPFEDRAEDLPIIGEVRRQFGVVLGLAGLELAAERFQCGLHLTVYFFEVCAVCLCATGLGLQQIVPNVGSGKVKLGSYVIERMILQKELGSNLVLVPPDLLENSYAVDSRESHDCQKAPETGPQSKTRTQQEPIWTAWAGIVHLNCLCMGQLSV